MMRNIIIYSYPCLKTTVENYSHSDTPLLLPLFIFDKYDSGQKLIFRSHLAKRED